MTQFLRYKLLSGHPPYLNSLEQIRLEYRDKDPGNIGIELGLQPHLKQYLDALVERFRPDWTLSSAPCHFADRLDPFDEKLLGRAHRRPSAFERFSQRILKRQNHGLLRCVPATWTIVHYAPHQNEQYSYERFRDLIDMILVGADPPRQGSGMQHRRPQIRSWTP